MSLNKCADPTHPLCKPNLSTVELKNRMHVVGPVEPSVRLEELESFAKHLG